SALEVRGFRNLEPQTVTLRPRFNVFAGENGQGKTNVLEAIYLATTSRSFRTSVIAECVRHESDLAHVTVRVDDGRDPGAPPRDQTVDIVEGRRRVRID